MVNTESTPNPTPEDETGTDVPFEAADTAGEDTTVGAENGAELLAQQVAELQAKLEEADAERLRALADAQNAQARADRRIAENTKYAVSNMARALLSVADNLERALMAAPEELQAEHAALKTLAQGVDMTASELQNVLAQSGVKPVEAEGAPFDPNLHQAVQEMEDTSVPNGTVVQVHQKGYMIHDRLLRPSMVVVSKGGPKREATVAREADAGGEDAASGVNKEV